MDNKMKLEQMLESINRNDYVKEHMFIIGRRFRFDYAWIDKKIAIEYEGIFGGKSRHTTITGFTNDCFKYNTATLQGWKVYRVTAKDFTKKNLELTLDFLKLIFQVTESRDMESFERHILSNPGSAKQFLINAGICNSKGKLNKNYI